MASNKYGFLKDEVKQEDYIFGDAQLQAPKLRVDGQWDDFLPPEELQANRGYETYACATFALLNCIEILIRRQFTLTDNFSDRYLAKISGTDINRGNSPQTVAEFLRKRGCVTETEWPDNATSTDDYYRTVPPPLHQSALQFLKNYEMGHDWVPNDPTSMMNALQYSPLAISVPAWYQDEKGFYYDPGIPNNHMTVCYGYVKDQYWKIYDTYDNTHKKLRWDVRPEAIKRYSVKIAPPLQSFLDKALQFFSDWLNANKPKPMPNQLLNSFCLAVQRHEGWYWGSRSQRNHNPGNCKYSSVGYAPIYGEVKKDPQGFAIFKDYETGFLYLKNLVKGKIEKNPNQNFYDFFKIYAPAEDANDPKRYAEVVAKACGMSPTDRLGALVNL